MLVDLCQSFYAAFAKGDTGAIVNGCADCVRWTVCGVVGTPMNTTFEGRKGVKKLFALMKADVKWSSFVPERFIEEKNIVVVLGAAQGLVFHHPEATWCLTQVWIFNANNMVIETQDRWCV
jgi:ketosteroid isomerase-like protein